jgi:hypothetical protein
VSVLEGSLSTARRRAMAAEASSTASGDEVTAAFTDLQSRDATIARLRAELRACGHSGSSSGGLSTPLRNRSNTAPTAHAASVQTDDTGPTTPALVQSAVPLATAASQTEQCRATADTASQSADLDPASAAAAQAGRQSPGAAADLDAMWHALQDTQAAAAMSSAVRAEASAAADRMRTQLAYAEDAHAIALREIAAAAGVDGALDASDLTASRLTAHIVAQRPLQLQHRTMRYRCAMRANTQAVCSLVPDRAYVRHSMT